jgi:hypothetical protein
MVFAVPLGEKNIFCKYTKEFDMFGFNTKSAEEKRSTADAHRKKRANPFKILFLLNIFA